MASVPQTHRTLHEHAYRRNAFRRPNDLLGKCKHTFVHSKSIHHRRSLEKQAAKPQFYTAITRGASTSSYREGEFHTTLSNLTHPLRINSPLSGQPKPCPRGGSSVVMSAVSRHSKVNTGNFQNDSGAHSSGMRHSKTSCSVICDWEVEGGPWGGGRRRISEARNYELVPDKMDL